MTNAMHHHHQQWRRVRERDTNCGGNGWSMIWVEFLFVITKDFWSFWFGSHRHCGRMTHEIQN